MFKFKKMASVWAVTLCTTAPALWAAQTQSMQDYHLSVYHGAQEQVSDIELFTKMPNKEVFFGVSCSEMSPFVMVQMVLLNDAVLLESPRLLSVSYKIDGVVQAIALQGIVTVVDTAEEYSNKVRFELATGNAKLKLANLQQMQAHYNQLLDALQNGQQIDIRLEHKSIGVRDYVFSLNGLKPLLAPYTEVCK
ncbi:hypothetical protein [Thiomicrorhabdus aquaedulcis]|uniref:hypothetical protein n=1 Tax=Thiomicrorhabdus aquaedulcis TaxID=2211106 RepID=UPI000FDC3997|nr:hypothetical protein [Thiomicrorhabdus aquaedulcis]